MHRTSNLTYPKQTQTLQKALKSQPNLSKSLPNLLSKPKHSKKYRNRNLSYRNRNLTYPKQTHQDPIWIHFIEFYQGGPAFASNVKQSRSKETHGLDPVYRVSSGWSSSCIERQIIKIQRKPWVGSCL